MNGNWLLCDFHIHTDFSDGVLPLREVVDLYGSKGFDVIGVSDHILDTGTLKRCLDAGQDPHVVIKEEYPDYLHALWQEARRAWESFRMLLIPGTEITNNADGYHILAVDSKVFIDPGGTVEEIVQGIHKQGGIAIAPHPHWGSRNDTNELMHIWANRVRYAPLFDAWEVANRDDLFPVVGLKKFNYVANSDFHERRHLYSWKTLLKCEKNTEAVKQAIRRNEGVSIYLFREDKVLE